MEQTMSGILGSILGSLSEQGGQSNAIAGVLQQVLSQNGGGLNALLSRFQDAGLGSQAQSWVSTAPNQPISSEHIDQVFSQDEISGWAAQAGTSQDKMREVLAEALPHAVSHVTPEGQVPDQMPDLSSLIQQFLRR
ncbi:MAG TPA: YidB family protein [Acetobacteraceae bacterium]|nr:YidB family protein [Acetobacteraceae bacterium]